MLSNRSQFGVYRSLVLVVPIFGLTACGTQVIKVPVDTRCYKQEAITLTEDEAKATAVCSIGSTRTTARSGYRVPMCTKHRPHVRNHRRDMEGNRMGSCGVCDWIPNPGHR